MGENIDAQNESESEYIKAVAKYIYFKCNLMEYY